jgi:hypothetical protein
MRKWILAIVYGLLSTVYGFSLLVWADDEPTVKGTFETRVFTAGDVRVDTILDLEFDLPLSDQFKFRFRPWANLDLVGRNERHNVTDVRPRVHPRLVEGYVEWNDGPWEVRLGQQLVELGSIDKISPLDVWRPRDFRDLLVDEPIGLPLASVTYATERTSLRLLYAPAQPASLFPGPESDWWSGPRVEFARSHPVGAAYGLHVQHRLGGVAQVGMVAFDHPDPAPLYRLAAPGLTEQYVRDRVLGGHVRFPISEWTATLEAIQHWPDQPKVPYRVVVGQVEKIWQLSGNETLTVDLGYADRTGGSNLDFDLNFPFRSAPFVNLNYMNQDEQGLDTTFQLRAIGSDASGWYVNPEFSRQVTPDQRLSLGASLLFGRPGTFLGDFRANSRLEAKWQIKF